MREFEFESFGGGGLSAHPGTSWGAIFLPRSGSSCFVYCVCRLSFNTFVATVEQGVIGLNSQFCPQTKSEHRVRAL